MIGVWMSVLRADAKRVVRDPFLLLIVTYLPLFALASRWLVPWIAERVHDSVDLVPYYPVLVAMFCLILPYIMGVVLGLQLLEEKDERSLSALAVTPFSVRRYFQLRVTTYATVGTLMAIVSHEAMGIVAIPLWQLVAVVFSFALSTGVSALLVAIIAKNQVQGFAVMKGSGFLVVAPIASFFVPAPWDYAFGVIPFFWPIKAYYVAIAGGSGAAFWIAVGLAVVVQAVAIGVLYRMFERRILSA